jgi:hypothetical protein
MNTHAEDADLDIPEIDLSMVEWRPNPFARKPGERTEIRIDGAVEYELRLIPSGRALGRFASTLEAWPAILEAVEHGRSPRTLSLDALGSAGERWHIGAGQLLVRVARLNNGRDIKAVATKPVRGPRSGIVRRRPPEAARTRR